jgi:magnesium chelatase subunit D
MSAAAARVRAALALVAVDPGGLGGLWLRGRAGPAREAAVAALAPLAPRRLHPGVDDATLYGGLDLAATLAAGRRIGTPGLLAAAPVLLLTMAERCPAGLAVRLGQWLDAGRGGAVVALDEGAEDGEAPPPALTDRLALFLDLSETRAADLADLAPDPARIAAARERLPHVTAGPDAAATLARAAARLGIGSLRAPLLALAAARAAAAWAGRIETAGADLRLAADLVFAHRALAVPDPPEAEPPAPEPAQPQPPPEAGAPPARPEETPLPEEMLVAAVRAALPADLLARLAAARAARRAQGASGSGAARAGNRRGRPLPSRPGRPGGPARIDPVATLRAAAPWQPLRRRLGADPGRDGLRFRAADLHVRRFRETSDRVLIFAVDASGSAALARLGEAKGAVELLLARAYARRDHVALVAFRGAGAEVLLPPTRSLVQTKRRLAGLPGGGGTPLAAGIDAALALALKARARGLTPTLALLTDGRANITRAGTADRPAAAAEAEAAARLVAAAGVPAVVIDTATRPQEALRHLAAGMGAAYLALPRADAARLSAALGGAMAG